MNETKKKEMETLIEALNEASSAYYNGATSAMSDREWDAMFDRLKKMEEETGIVYPNSPTQMVGAPVKVDELREVRHEFSARSLDKTKDITVFPKIFGKRAAGMAGITVTFRLRKMKLKERNLRMQMSIFPMSSMSFPMVLRMKKKISRLVMMIFEKCL